MRKQLYERQKLLKSNQHNKLQPLHVISRYTHLPTGIVKIIAFAVAATFATSLYGYITRSPSLEPYFSWNW